MKNKPRGTKHFKYRNAAVRQGTVLGKEKLVLITCAEFCQDDGTFFHGIRSLVVATGFGQGTVKRCMDSLKDKGAIERTHRGFAPGNSSRYRLNLAWLEDQPTIYDLVKEKNLLTGKKPVGEKNLGNKPYHRGTEPFPPDPVPYHRGTEPFQCGTKGVDVDVDSMWTEGRDAVGDTPTPPCLPPTAFDGNQDQGQPQKSTPVNGTGKLVQATAASASQTSPIRPRAKGNPNVKPCACGRPVWRGKWCKLCHADGQYA